MDEKNDQIELQLSRSSAVLTNLECVSPVPSLTVESLIYWRDVKKSGIVCGAGMAILLAMSCFSVISVFAYVSLIVLLGTVAFRIYKIVMQAIQKTSEGHPFK